jgi:hypothetical protein
MKTLLTTSFYIALLFIVSTLFTGCKKDPESEPQGVGQLRIEFENVVGDDPLTLNTQTYTNANGDAFTVTMFKYYISNIKLQKADGSEYVQPESYYLIDEEEASSKVITLDSIPTGDYTGITFTIGVDSTRNVSGAQTGALDPLHGMFWTWNSGYIYVKMEGYSPQSANGGLVFHIGGFKSPNNCIRSVSPEMEGKKFSIKTTSTPEVHFKADMAEMFKGTNVIKFSELSFTMGGPNSVPVANNYVGMFTLDHIHD